MLKIFAVILGLLLILMVLWETFETIVLPRRVTRQFRLTRFFYRSTWRPWTWLAALRSNKKKHDSLLSYYGPLSLLLLLALWAVTLVVGFGLLHYGLHDKLSGALFASDFGNAMYLSGTTLFTLGLGDVLPASPLGRFITVLEAGIGFGYLALVIGYLPVLYQAFSRREVTISLLDARAGSPPTAYELLRRQSGVHGLEALTQLLEDWEIWSADLMESHLSYPVLAYFRSQHDNQSWIASLTAILDVCALAMVGLEGMCQYQARMTFAIARHALVDLSQVFSAPPAKEEKINRLPAEALDELRKRLHIEGFILADSDHALEELRRLRSLYEPYALSLAAYLRLDLPPWIKGIVAKDNWQTTAWQLSQAKQQAIPAHDEHT
ncbi:MAG TPA: potassium channel family protein [Candidatus Polarisedimenticolia bacterium]|nr:potassium channel family protein [Candidatus Polarisedimenticolia bacterium]